MLQEVLGLEGSASGAAAGFGGGVGRHQSVCGAVVGATIALGLHGGRQLEDPRGIADAVRPKTRELAQGFLDRFGSLECRNLVPFDFNAPGGYDSFRQSGVKQQKCHHYVGYAVRTVAEGLAAGDLLAARS